MHRLFQPTLGANLFQIMKGKGISATALSRCSSVDMQLISAICKGKEVKFETVSKIAAALNMLPETLCGTLLLSIPARCRLVRLNDNEKKRLSMNPTARLINSLLKEGLNQCQISRAIGISRQGVSDYMKRHGLTYNKPVKKKPKKLTAGHGQRAIARAALMCGISLETVRKAFHNAEWVDSVEQVPTSDGIISGDRQLLIAYYLGQGLYVADALRKAGFTNPRQPAGFRVRERLQQLGVKLNSTDGRKRERNGSRQTDSV